MKSKVVTLLDYGMANLLNVKRALECCGATVEIVDSPKKSMKGSRLVVPGVGAFKDCMFALREKGLDDFLKRYAEEGRPLLGICVGMQILFEVGEEFGSHDGLGILRGRVKKLPMTADDGNIIRVPHIGWNNLVPADNEKSWSGTLLEPFSAKPSSFYFVHSFAALPENVEDRLADCMYGGYRICSVVQQKNIMGTQFHPERSAHNGLLLIKHFLTF